MCSDNAVRNNYKRFKTEATDTHERTCIKITTKVYFVRDEKRMSLLCQLLEKFIANVLTLCVPNSDFFIIGTRAT